MRKRLRLRHQRDQEQLTMPIYMTPFNPGPPPVATGDSIDMGINSMETARQLLGEPLQELNGGAMLKQQNVIHGYYAWAAATSYGIALADVMVVIGVVQHGIAAVLWVGTGGALGVVSAMRLHKRMRR